MHTKYLLVIVAVSCMLILVTDTHSQGTAQLYLTDMGAETLTVANADGTNPQILFQESDPFSNLGYFQVVPELNSIYYVLQGPGSIIRRDLNGGSRTQILTDPGTDINFIAVDVQGGKIYWTSDLDVVRRANLDGTAIETIVSLPSISGNPHGIALDIPGGKVYWTVDGLGLVQRANLDGSNVETVVSSPFPDANGIELDLINRKAYWASDSDVIQRVNLDGNGLETIATTSNPIDNPFDVTLDIQAGKVYWVEVGAGAIRRANLDGTGIETVRTGLIGLAGIQLVGSTVTPPATSDSDMTDNDDTQEAAAIPLCNTIDSDITDVVRASVPPSVFYTINCRIIAENRVFIRSSAEVGIMDVLNRGVIHAVDVFSPSGESAAMSTICLRGINAILFIDASTAPRTWYPLPTTLSGEYNCVQIPDAGIVVMVEN